MNGGRSGRGGESLGEASDMDVDWFRFDATAGQILSVSVTPSTWSMRSPGAGSGVCQALAPTPTAWTGVFSLVEKVRLSPLAEKREPKFKGY